MLIFCGLTDIIKKSCESRIMPFVKRKVEPNQIRRHHHDDEGEIFEEHSDVVNNALVKALLQLSSVTHHAEDIFREIEEEMESIFKRSSKINERLEKLQHTSEQLNPKEVQIPVSDLDSELRTPLHLHYRSCDSVEEDLFTVDSRTPSLIHLHQSARNDWNSVLRGSQAYAKSPRPKSLDPRILLQDQHTPRCVASAYSTISIAASPALTELYNPQSLLPTPKEKMAIESSQHKAQVITVDTSGTQFERRVNLRKSQRSSISAVRRKSQHKFRERHKTLSAFPGSVSHELGLNGMHRPSSMHSDVNSNSSFIGEGSVASGDSTFTPREKQNNEMQTDDVKVLPGSPMRRKLKNRLSMPLVKSVPVSPQRGARVSLQHTDDNNSTFPRSHFPEPKTVGNEANAQNGHVSLQEEDCSNKQQAFMREKNNMGEDRTSSGFWSGTESCRHSATSEILMQHHNVTQALQQVLSKKPAPASYEHHPGSNENDVNASTSTLSINSRLSILEQSPLSSSGVSLSQDSLPQSTDLVPSPDNSISTPRSELRTPRQLTFSTPAGAYNFMNPGYVESQTKFNHLKSPMDLLILGNRRGNDGLMRSDTSSVNSSLHSPNQDPSARSMYNDSCVFKMDPYLDKHSVFTPNTPQTVDVYNVGAGTPLRNGVPNSHFFGTDFIALDERLRQKQFLRQQKQHSVKRNDPSLQMELKTRLHQEGVNTKKSQSKPPPPSRASSLKSHHEAKEILAYMEPLSDPNKMAALLPPQQSTTPDKLPGYYQVQSTKMFGIPGSVERKRINSARTSSSSLKLSTPPSKGDLQQDLKNLLQQKNRGLSSSKPDNESTKQQTPLSQTKNHPSIPTTQPEQPITVQAVSEEPALSTQASATESPSLPGQIESSKSSSTNKFVKPLSLVNRPLRSPITSDEAVRPRGLASSPLTKTHPPQTIAGDNRTPTKSPLSFTFLEANSGMNNAGLHSQKFPSEIEKPQSTENKALTEAPFQEDGDKRLPFVSQVEEKSPTITTTVVKLVTTSESETPLKETLPVKPLVITPVDEAGVVGGQDLSQTGPPVLSPVKPPVAAKPSRQKVSSKPAVRPKPLLLPKPNSFQEKNKLAKKETSQISANNQHVKERTASARAAFFGLPSPPAVKKPKEQIASPTQQPSQKQAEPVIDGETDIDAIDKGETEGDSESKNEDVEPIGFSADVKSETKSPASETKSSESPPLVETTEQQGESSQSIPANEQQTTQKEPTAPDCDEKLNAEDNAASAENEIADETYDALNGKSSPRDGVQERDGSHGNYTTAETISSPVSASSKTSDFLSSMHKLRGSLRASSPEGHGHKYSVRSPPCADRRSNGRHSTSSIDRRRKMTSGSTSREDFKALLLQSFSKPGSGSQMSAAEKLKMGMQSSKVNGTSNSDNDASENKPEGSRQGIVSMGDIRAAVSSTRQGRRQNRSPDYRMSYAGSISYSNKKHPPLSHGGRYSVRSKTPTRPMLAISEDSETETSPDKKEERTRSASVPHL